MTEPTHQPYPPPAYAQPHVPQRGVTKQRKSTSHTFHLLMSLLTGGAWALLVWLPLTLWHKLGPRRKVVTRYR